VACPTGRCRPDELAPCQYNGIGLLIKITKAGDEY